MNNKRIVITALGFCIVAITAFSIGSSFSHNDLRQKDIKRLKSDQSTGLTTIAGLTSENRKDREKAVDRIRKERTELIKDLIELAAEEVELLPSSDPIFAQYPWHDSKHLAILLAGDLRAAEAIPILLENLEYRNPRRLWGSSLDKDGWYPAVEALSEIGMPAVGPTITKLGTYPSKSQRRELCCWILKRILGVRLARLRLQIAIEETRDQPVKENLIAALPYFKTEQEKAAEERAQLDTGAG